MCLFRLKGATRGNKSNGVEATIISNFPEGIAPLTDIAYSPFFHLTVPGKIIRRPSSRRGENY